MTRASPSIHPSILAIPPPPPHPPTTTFFSDATREYRAHQPSRTANATVLRASRFLAGDDTAGRRYGTARRQHPCEKESDGWVSSRLAARFVHFSGSVGVGPSCSRHGQTLSVSGKRKTIARGRESRPRTGEMARRSWTRKPAWFWLVVRLRARLDILDGQRKENGFALIFI
jgi:hypothetical protein